MTKDYYTIDDISQITGSSYSVVVKAIYRGEIEAQKINGRWFVRKEALNDWNHGIHKDTQNEAAQKLMRMNERAKEEGANPVSDKEISPQQAAIISGYNESTIVRAVQRGAIAGRKIGGRWVVNKDDVINFRAGTAPRASHTRNRQEKLEQAHEGGLDLKCENPDLVPKTAPENSDFVEKMALEDGFISKYTPELDTDDIDDPVAVALFEAAYAQIAIAFDLVSRAAAYMALKEKKKEYDA